MNQFAHGLGGHLHLLRYLGWHRGLLEARIGEVMRAKSIRWLDHGFDSGGEALDQPLAGLEFLPQRSAARAAWRSIWPNDLHPVTWDAVAEIVGPRDTEWVLIEANAHLEELASNCDSKNWRDGLSLITDGLARTQNALGVPMEADWLKGHYRYASRLSALNFLLSQGVKCRLLVICFSGDRSDVRRKCPANPREWETALGARDRQLQLPARHRLSNQIHRLFLDVSPQSAQSLSPAMGAGNWGELLHEASE
jgi:hypothetical protein